ncbi:hypothetical protein IU433_30615 [Nocardia puris]|uniref:Uncharacterized protein n=1 Tax=Nocardia puris TaxID=208602 RepID=A0A366D0J7_9NOCA|nr:hypothetical protein [Nocardia puris]MBF6463357.1 hypothetical protein [Nocardia puris]RBO82984.1 hypothetical protein DFR74_12174 [Nocardia puris]
MSVVFTYEICLPARNIGRALTALEGLAPRCPSAAEGTIVVLPVWTGGSREGQRVPFSHADGLDVVDCSDGTDLSLAASLLVEPDGEVRRWLWDDPAEPPPGALDESGRVALDGLILHVRFTGYAPGYAVMRFIALPNAVGSTFYSSPNVADMFIGLTVAAGGVCCGWSAETSSKWLTFLNGKRGSYRVGEPDGDFPSMAEVARTWPALGADAADLEAASSSRDDTDSGQNP